MKHLRATVSVNYQVIIDLEESLLAPDLLLIYLIYLYYKYNNNEKSAFCLQIQDKICFLNYLLFTRASSYYKVITILLPVQTVSVTLMYPMFMLCTKHILQFEYKPSDKNEWTLAVCKKKLWRKAFKCGTLVSIWEHYKKELINIKKNKENLASVSWLDSTFWDTSYISIKIVLIGRNKMKKRKKIFSLQLSRTRAEHVQYYKIFRSSAELIIKTSQT